MTDDSPSGALDSEREKENPARYEEHCLLDLHCKLGKKSTLIKSQVFCIEIIGEKLSFKGV